MLLRMLPIRVSVDEYFVVLGQFACAAQLIMRDLVCGSPAEW